MNGFTVVSATSITTTVPANASTGTLNVTTPGGTVTSTVSFEVLGGVYIVRCGAVAGQLLIQP